MKKLISILVLVIFSVLVVNAQYVQVKKELVAKMIKDGDTTASCVREEGGAIKFLVVNSLYLNQDKQPEYLVTGKGCDCEGSMRCASSIYQKIKSGYRKLYRSESNEDIEVLKTRTRGYKNLQVTLISGSQTYTAIQKFNGRRYQ